MNAKDKESSTGNHGVGVLTPANKRKMTIARYHWDMAEDYRKKKEPDNWEEIARKHDQEGARIENQVYAILKDKEKGED